MAKQQRDTREVARLLKERGLNCKGIQRRIDKNNKDANDFRRLGFNRLASAEDNVSTQLKQLKKKVCLLK